MNGFYSLPVTGCLFDAELYKAYGCRVHLGSTEGWCHRPGVGSDVQPESHHPRCEGRVVRHCCACGKMMHAGIAFGWSVQRRAVFVFNDFGKVGISDD